MRSAVIIPQYVVALSVRPSDGLSVTFRYRDDIGWNTSKIISRLKVFAQNSGGIGVGSIGSRI